MRRDCAISGVRRAAGWGGPRARARNGIGRQGAPSRPRPRPSAGHPRARGPPGRQRTRWAARAWVGDVDVFGSGAETHSKSFAQLQTASASADQNEPEDLRSGLGGRSSSIWSLAKSRSGDLVWSPSLGGFPAAEEPPTRSHLDDVTSERSPDRKFDARGFCSEIRILPARSDRNDQR